MKRTTKHLLFLCIVLLVVLADTQFHWSDRLSQWLEPKPTEIQQEIPSQNRPETPDPSPITYGFDDQGRVISAKLTIDSSLRQLGKDTPRPDISHIKPLGWGNNEIVDVTFSSGKTYHGYFWNRSHLIAHSLGAVGTDPNNFITGTRAQNVGDNTGTGGMAYPETVARDFLDKYPDKTIDYAVYVYYDKPTDVIPKSTRVIMTFSDGRQPLDTIIVNDMPGFIIDYETGTFTAR